MKKLLAFLLAMTLALSIGLTAFAEEVHEGTQTITTTVSASAPTWTITIPATVTIPYRQEETNIGNATIELTNGSTLRPRDLIYVAIRVEQKLYNSDKSKYIPFVLTIPQYPPDDRNPNGINKTLSDYDISEAEEAVGWLGLRAEYPDGSEERFSPYPFTGDIYLNISESAWNSASNGTYKAEITYISALVQD